MREGRGSSLLHLLVILLSLIAFGFAIAAERRRSHGTVEHDIHTNTTYCAYSSDIATGYGVGGFLFLLSSESLLMGVTKCMCFGRPLTPGNSRAWTIIYFLSSWVTFLVAEACLIAGATKNAYHTRYLHGQHFSCENLRKGVFIAGAIFVLINMTLNIYYYMYFSKATSSQSEAPKGSHTTPTVGMAGYRKN
ncbi:hypothetical protein RND81_02G193900 [Saponaria officinalis]|uniref:Fiber protein Fb34 n=1 Tax=Saponaria officinalis TaxID=3572 RepID=A0AAW1MRM0_SAPOF